MNTSDLIAELRDNKLRDASSADSLWSDETLVLYLNQALAEFAEETLTIRDKTTVAVTQFTLAAATVEYVLNPAVLAVYSVRYDTDVYNLPLITHNMLYENVRRDVDWFDINNATAFSPGRPQAYQLDESNKVLTVYPPPSSAEVGKKLYMRVARLPLTDMVVGQDLVPEIPARYHLALTNGAAALALDNHDVDGEASPVAARFRKKFEREMFTARRRFQRLNHAPLRFNLGGFGWP